LKKKWRIEKMIVFRGDIITSPLSNLKLKNVIARVKYGGCSMITIRILMSFSLISLSCQSSLGYIIDLAYVFEYYFQEKEFSSDVAARGAVFTLRISSDPNSEARVDDIVSFHRRDYNVADPKADEDGRGQNFDGLGSTQLSADSG
jgi:hypothetical protein